MSIDSQIKEMGALAKKEGLKVKEIRQESCSAKVSGYRPIFSQLLVDIREGFFNGILTWAPDRLSRNAGDLGMLVDLIDQEKLLRIRTFSQTFSNNPNEKFLLMILCSQAKLENDQKGINVKRGIRAKCEMGWRPGMAPPGYYNRAYGGVKDIIVDPERGPIIKQMFERVAYRKNSGRDIKQWMKEIGFKTRNNKDICLSEIYAILKNPFYFGEFQYPVSSGIWYKGSHEPLITKELYLKTQRQLVTSPKEWGKKTFTFKGFFKCASCGSSIVGEDKLRKRKVGEPRRHIYYHCTRQVNYSCPEPYIDEEKLTKVLIKRFANQSVDQINISEMVKQSMRNYQKIRDDILLKEEIDPKNPEVSISEYANYILKNGSLQEKRDLMETINTPLYLHNLGISTTRV